MMTQEQIIEMSLNPTLDVIRDSYDLCRQRLHQYITNRVIDLDKEFGNEAHCDIVLDDGFTYPLINESTETMLKIAEGL